MRRSCRRLVKYVGVLLVLGLVSLVLVMTWSREQTFQETLRYITTFQVSTVTLQQTTTSPPKTTTSPPKTVKTSPKTCSKINHVAFLKVHKAGSSTITNILQRYAVRNNLNVVLPNKKEGEYGFNYLGHGRNFSMKSVIPIPKGENYNILCNHVVYNRTMFRKLLPKQTFYFAIIREPEERFVSAAFYYGLVQTLKKKVPGINSTMYIFTEWLKNPWKLGVSMETYNHAAYDFGIEMKYFNNASYVQKYVRSLDSDFDLVLLMNYFDESLMLLRRKLCWSHKDMIYLKRNRGQYTVKYALSEQDRFRLKKWLMADRVIYEHFRSRFWRQIEAEGQGLFEETEFFKDVLRRVRDYCEFGTSRWPSLDIQSSTWSDSITVTRYDCQGMDMNDLALVKKLQKTAWGRYNASKVSSKSSKVKTKNLQI